MNFTISCNNLQLSAVKGKIDNNMTGQKHIFSLGTLYHMAHDLHNSGRRIGITHGAFDLFHASHLDLLKKASECCDFLIVGVDCDENIASYKSYKRPIIKEKDRLAIINEIHCVDAVFINTTPVGVKGIDKFAQLYKELFVDVIAIGTSFGFPEAIEAEARKAEAKLVRINTKQYPLSTSSIIDSILSKYNAS